MEAAVSNGTMWLNEVFRFTNRRRKLFGSRGPRISFLEALWSILCGGTVLAILLGLYFAFGDPWYLMFFTWPPAIIIWTILALFMGRRVAYLSPLRRRTGEGTGTWLSIVLQSMVVRVSGAFQRPVMYNKCVTRMGNRDGKETVIECVEWIGTARSPRMPYVPDPMNPVMGDVKFPPRGRRVPIRRLAQFEDRRHR